MNLPVFFGRSSWALRKSAFSFPWTPGGWRGNLQPGRKNLGELEALLKKKREMNNMLFIVRWLHGQGRPGGILREAVFLVWSPRRSPLWDITIKRWKYWCVQYFSIYKGRDLALRWWRAPEKGGLGDGVWKKIYSDATRLMGGRRAQF